MRRLIVLFVSVIAISSCNNATENKKVEAPVAEAPSAPAASKLSAAGTSALMTVIGDYYSLKDAFVASDTAKANAAAQKVVVSVSAMTAALKTDSADGKTVQPYLDTMQLKAQEIAAANGNLEQKRASFEKVSDAMYAVLKDADLKNAHVYRQYCPMAFERGAYWLSSEAEIKNPYYGKKMLDCGEVRDSLK
ncbi:DUF3347 domain-containing protein [Chitinophagaceae bacterium MMS25-I14]